MNEAKYAEGIFYNPKNPKAPEFVLGGISIKREEALNWLAKEDGEWVNLDIKVSKKTGKPYLQVNEWKPSGEKSYSYKSTDTVVNPINNMTVPF
jgi:hypothetical protein